LLVAIAADTGPDVTTFDRPYLAEWGSQGMLMPIDKYLTRDNLGAKDYLPHAWKECVYQGTTYGMPLETDSRPMFYNKDMIVKAGMDPDNLPELIPEFDAAMRKLTRYDASGNFTQLGFVQWTRQGSALSTWAASWGSRFVDEKTQKITMNEPKNLEILEWLQDYDRRFGYEATKAWFSKVGRDPFEAGVLGAVVDTNSFIERTGAKVPFDLAVGQLPRPANGLRNATYAGGWGIVILSRTKKADAAWEFMKYWTGPYVWRELARRTARIPTLLEVAREPILYEGLKAKAMALFENAWVRPVTPVMYMLWPEMKDATNRVLIKKEAPKGVLDDITTRVQAELDKVLAKQRK
jgi:multiple sugar transport system substrate-binding protein